ncbi:type III-B CRISPR module-associated Cmr3 family protein [Vibrio aerogenes]|uniref:type III-B CRISPR module-associated Cmr3 family protein n=1 Tax=Vibrio aerogenes TaxID=92172 RepID=UPI0021C2FB57|nr:type III-B CRISPR module-associated Cmr3 family protein [Vibrio aerogenes]
MTDHTIHLLIHPHDTWYFRDGRNHNGSAQIAAISKLIPPQRTILGALMALLKQTVGSKLSDADNQQLFQDDWQDTPPVHLSPVRLKYQSQYYIPAPRLVVEQIFSNKKEEENKKEENKNKKEENKNKKEEKNNEIEKFACLRPDLKKSFETDLGTIHHLSLEDEHQEYRLRQLWIKQGEPLNFNPKILSEVMLDPETLICRETRLGIGLNAAKKSAEDGQIYLTEHIRHQQGFSNQDLCFAVSLTFENTNIKQIFHEHLKKTGSYIRFGAEGRMAFIDEDEEKFQSYPTIDNQFKYADGDLFAINLISPCPVSQWPKFTQEMKDRFNNCELLNQLTDKPMSIGGWQSERNIEKSQANAEKNKAGPVNAEHFYESGSCLLFRLPQNTKLKNWFSQQLSESSVSQFPQSQPYALYGYGHYTLIPLK